MLLLYLSLLLLHEFNFEFLIVLRLQIANTLRFLACVLNFFHSSSFFLLEHAHSVLQLFDVFLDLQANCSRLVVSEIFGLNINDYVLEPMLSVGLILGGGRARLLALVAIWSNIGHCF